MPAERRQAFRREPIIVDLDESGTNFVTVAPITWERRNDFGSAVIHQSTIQVNEAIRLFVDGDVPQLEASYADKFTDGQELLKLGLPESEFEKLPSELYYNQVLELLFAILEVNQLEHLRPLLDPNFQAPTESGGILSRLIGGLTTQNPESGDDSSSQDSIETPSEISPTPS